MIYDYVGYKFKRKIAYRIQHLVGYMLHHYIYLYACAMTEMWRLCRTTTYKQGNARSTEATLVPSPKWEGYGNVHFHCTVTVSPGMADLSNHTACPGRLYPAEPANERDMRG